MKAFIIGFITALIIAAWVILAVLGIIPIKVAIIAPIILILGLVGGFLIFGLILTSTL